MLELVIFDVDGTLTPQRPSSTADSPVVPLPGRQEKLAELAAAGVLIAVASNQGGARPGKPGRMTWGVVLRRMRLVRKLFPQIRALKFAVARGPRKKPAPGMLLELMAEFGVRPDETLFVGDAESDRVAAARAGCSFAWADDYFE